MIVQSPGNEPVKTLQSQSRLHSAQRSKEQLHFRQTAPSLVRATMNFVFQTLQPLSIVDEPTFSNLLQIAEPKFQLPRHTFITSKVLPEAYSEVRTAVEKQLATAENVP